MFGVLLFSMLYGLAAFFYPGGSPVDQHSVGFSWLHNYWCNLLDSVAINGASNGAKPIAALAMLVLCVTLSMFWWDFPTVTKSAAGITWTIRVSGLISMTVLLLLLTPVKHDLVTNLASAFGLTAVVGTLYCLRRLGWNQIFGFGLLNLALVLVNNYLYYNSSLIVFLPLVQKVTFVLFLSWIGCIGWKLHAASSAAR